jgi:CubicO group peptidase (beta-lactamase class C family)
LKEEIVALSDVSIEGAVAPGFEPVRDLFIANFERDGPLREVGASVSVYQRGRRVVDLWGGYRDAARTRPWARDTLANVYSTTKGIVAVAVAMAVERGLIDYAAPVVRYWPEYGAAGKERTTVAQALSHQAGLPGFAEPTGPEDVYDWAGACEKLARQAPSWVPGEATSYHAGTFGFLAGEIFRRATGKTLGAFIASDIAGPLGADIHLGLPVFEDARVAEMIAPAAAPDLAALNLPPAAMMALTNPDLAPQQANTRAWRAAELPAMNMHATADGVARVYGALANGGELDGVRVMKPQTIARMLEVQSRRRDMMLGVEIEWAHGLPRNNTGVFGPNPNAFGHTGWGGSFGYADPDSGIGAAYVMNRMGPELVGDARAVGLARAISNCA